MKRRVIIITVLLAFALIISCNSALATDEGPAIVESPIPAATPEIVETPTPDATPASPSPEGGAPAGLLSAAPITTEPITTEPALTGPVDEIPVVKGPETTTPEVTKIATVEPDSTKIASVEPKTTDPVTTEPTTDPVADGEVLSKGPMLRGSGVPETPAEPTPTVGARSATNENGDVFLGGNYLEVGISVGGSFGTSTAAPSDFHSHATSANNYAVGLLMDGDGWDVGNPPTTGDFFLPGSPEERYGVAYEMDGVTYEYFRCDRYNDQMAYWGDQITNELTAYTTDDSDLSKGLLKATVHATTPHNVVVENTYSFGVDDKFYKTEVKVINNSGKELKNVRFFRSFDPDQDVDLHGTYYYDTFNKVICNPDSSQPGGSDNFAMVVARGSYTLEGFFLVSFDNRARASRGVDFAPDSLYLEGLWVESTPGLPNSSTDEALAMSFDNLNGYIYEDDAIAMTFNIGTLAVGETTELSHFSSLDPDVIESLNKIKQVINANVENSTDQSLTITVTDGYEYSIDGGKTWQTDGTFEGLKADTEYTILQRPVDGTNDDIVELLATTKKEGPATPDIGEKVITENSITVRGEANYEYSIDNGKTWQDSPEFNSLVPNTEYTIFARIKETSDTMPGKNSNPLTITTLAESETDLEELGIIVSVQIDGKTETIRINKGDLYAAIGEDEDIENALEEGKPVEIKFTVKDSVLSDEEKELVNSELKDGEEIVLTVDASIELYIDNEYVKNISELKKPITFTLTLPANLLSGDVKLAVILTHETSTGKYIVARLADGDSEKLTVTITSKDFSNYTIINQKEIAKTVAATVTTNEAVGGGSSGPAVITEVTPAKAVAHYYSPRTGDRIALCLIILAITSFGLVYSFVYDKNERFA